MRHDWVFDVLHDMLSYARRNDLPDLALHVERTLAAAEVEIAKADPPRRPARSETKH
ncbi:hypothetical protein Q9295_00020 [Xinfangfangia sp. CPCC 101601]|uniref:Uncharacterized protein n=1 Tax=Pseudogemmobacter lacusdianii TaxID=3069608 RepID=A0ABU0VSN2_9RHOB|nr:hypothetical protein [Xinfangfangia sp. CPCC 101601]MDQ2064745.1 hypothetical protein [Xinfangfangia sp. CPCC 101601]